MAPHPMLSAWHSGGPDSLALLTGAIRAGLTVHAIVVDHGLQSGSADIARRATDRAIALGATAEVVTVTVDGPGGMEAAARTARYAALDRARTGRPVLLGPRSTTRPKRYSGPGPRFGRPVAGGDA